MFYPSFKNKNAHLPILFFFQIANHNSKYFDELSEWDKDNSQTLQQMVGGKAKLGFLRQVKKLNKQNKAHLNKKEKQKERKRERKREI